MGSEVESLLASASSLICKVWIRMRGWYKYVLDRPPPPSRAALATMVAEMEELYRHVQFPGDPIPVGDIRFSLDDGIAEDEDITWAVHMLCLNRSGVPSGMQAEQLCWWLIAATWDDLPDVADWLQVFAIVQAVFRDGNLDEECMWQTVVLITKRKGGF